ncbi:MAG: AI-2E family transporter, partial [Inquilinus sp.]|nr:AI-2E family transporter [Inquilinus sp.]
VVLLTILLVGITATIAFVADMLVPVIVAVVIAYLLQGVVGRLESHKVPHIVAVVSVFLLFMAFLLFLVFGLLPLLIGQFSQLLQQVPRMVGEGQALLLQLPERYPDFISEQQARQFTARLGSELLLAGQRLLSYSVSSLVFVLTMIVYLILVPFLVFFLIKDKDRLIDWITGFLPRERQLSNEVWAEVNGQIANYVRGKFWEILIVGSVTFVVMTFLGLEFAALIGALTGLSVLMPFVGAASVTAPVAMVAYFQFGISPEFFYVLAAYGVIQALDGNVLAPLLFSEAVNLHPVAIIVAILLFGGLWGVWGVFFAIPLATVVQAVLRAWPRHARETEGDAEDGAATNDRVAAE